MYQQIFQNLFALLDVWRSSFLLLPIFFLLFHLIEFSLYKVLICLPLSIQAKLWWSWPIYRLAYGKEDDDIWDSEMKGKGVW